jgi:stage III sporulation protein AD
MDEVIKIVGIGIIALILIIIIKQYRPEFALYISLIAGALILYFALDKVTNIINLLKQICERSGVNSGFLGILIKMTGIAFLAEFGISICKDVGESAIASKVELGSKAVIISMSIPIIYNLLEVILKILPN